MVESIRFDKTNWAIAYEIMFCVIFAPTNKTRDGAHLPVTPPSLAPLPNSPCLLKQQTVWIFHTVFSDPHDADIQFIQEGCDLVNIAPICWYIGKG